MLDELPERVEARDFTLQVTWCCFAEDLGMFPELLLTKPPSGSTPTRTSSYDVLGELFEWLNWGR